MGEAEGQPSSLCSGLPSNEGKQAQVLGDKGRDGAEFPGLVCGPHCLFSCVSRLLLFPSRPSGMDAGSFPRSLLLQGLPLAFGLNPHFGCLDGIPPERLSPSSSSPRRLGGQT